MSDVDKNEQIVWTPQMPDRRRSDRRGNVREFYANGKSLNISDMKNASDRRTGYDRRKIITVTITGRAMEIEQNQRL